jgi:predicted permease
MLLQLFNTIAPLFLCAGLGYGWGRLGRPYDTRMITRLVSLIGAPCLVFATLAKIDGLSGAIGEMALASIAALSIFAATGAIVLRLAGIPLRTFLAPVTFPNVGNMGLALCFFAYGEDGLALAIGFFAVTASLQLTLGQWLMSGAASPWPAIKSPLPYAVGLGALFMTTSLEPPTFLLATTDLIGGITIPLMVITLGVSLAKFKAISLGRTAALAFFRLGLGVGVGFLLVYLLGFEGMQRGVLIIVCAMPVAIFNYLFAQYYDNRPEEVASLVLVSTAIALVFLPLLVYVAL